MSSEMNDYEKIKKAIKNHEISEAERIINSKLSNFAVNLKDFQFARFYDDKIVIYYNLWKLELKFEHGELVDKRTEDLVIYIAEDNGC